MRVSYPSQGCWVRVMGTKAKAISAEVADWHDADPTHGMYLVGGYPGLYPGRFIKGYGSE